MSNPDTKPTLLQTIEADLKAGISWFENEAENIGLFMWNTLKAVFNALEPAEAQILSDVLTGAVANANAGHTIEQIESAALNTATDEQKAVLAKAGSNVAQTFIAALRVNNG
jgi:hypothetical protein